MLSTRGAMAVGLEGVLTRVDNMVRDFEWLRVLVVQCHVTMLATTRLWC